MSRADLVAGGEARRTPVVEHDPTLSVRAWGTWLADQPDLDETTWPIRYAASLARRVADAAPGDRASMISAPPPLTGDARWDTFAAALAEWIAGTHGLRSPGWTASAERRVSPAWWVTSMASMRAWEFAGAPAAFRHRGIYIHRDSLTNV